MGKLSGKPLTPLYLKSSMISMAQSSAQQSLPTQEMSRSILDIGNFVTNNCLLRAGALV